MTTLTTNTRVPHTLFPHTSPEVMHVMLDLETTSLKLTARITSLALVPFSFHNAQVGEPSCWVLADYQGEGVIQCRDDAATMQWRKEHQLDAIEEALIWKLGYEQVAPKLLVDRLCHQFHEWRMQYANVYLWSWHTDFDVALLRHLCEAYNGQRPWHYQEVRDVPTAIHLQGKEPNDYKWAAMRHLEWVSHGAAQWHNPIDDCLGQIMALQTAFSDEMAAEIFGAGPPADAIPLA